MKKQNASKSKTQIFVPKGTVSPDEDTVIEIPYKLQGKPMIIAKKQDFQKRPDDKRADFSFKPYQPSVIQTAPDINLDRSLAETEKFERQSILSQLEQYHQARRKYLQEASALASSRPNLSPPSMAPQCNSTGICQGPSTIPAFPNTSGLQTSYQAPPPMSLTVPPLPKIQQQSSRFFESDDQGGCCDFAYPVGSSTLAPTSRRAKSSGTSTSDLGRDIPTIRITPTPDETNKFESTKEEEFNNRLSEKDMQTDKLKPLSGNTSSPTSLESLDELEKSFIGNGLERSMSAPTSSQSCGPCCKSVVNSMPDIKERYPTEILSKDELDKIQNLFDKARKNLQAVYSLASNLTCPAATSSKLGPTNATKQYCTDRKTGKTPTNTEGDMEKRLKESQELFKKETAELKKLLQQMKTNMCKLPPVVICPAIKGNLNSPITDTTCKAPPVVLCPGTDNNLTSPSTESTKKSCIPKTCSNQKSILKQPSNSGKSLLDEKDCPSLKKCVSVCSKANMQGPDQGNSRNAESGKLITVSTAVYLNDDPNPKNSNVTSTYYNKDFLLRSQSEKEIDGYKGPTRDVGVCTENNCPLYRNR